MVNRARLTQHLVDLVRIDSLSRRERNVARRLRQDLEGLGGRVEFDDAGQAVGGDTGNLIARFGGTVPAAPPLILCAHMDTVVPGEGITPVVEERVVRSDGRTILGGDDKSAVAVICEVLRVLPEDRVPHGDLEVVLTICEEVGLLGAKHLDVGRLRAREGFVLDGDLPEVVVTRSPSSNRMEFRVRGREAHAGVSPEKGINAIRVAAEAIAAMRLGRIDHETTANIGIIQGGLATNVVPNEVFIQGEARSHDEGNLEEQTRHMRQCFQEAAGRHCVTLDGTTFRAAVEEKVWRDYDRMRVPEDARVVRLLFQAGKNLGREMRFKTTGGGLDANILTARGIQVACLGSGQRQIHSLNEFVEIDDMVRCVELLVEAIRLNAGG